MTDEEAIKNCKELIEELNTKYKKDKEFIGRLYYKNKPIEENLQILLNLIENQQKEIEYWKNKYDKELTENIAYITKIVNQDNRIKELEKAVEKKDKVIRKMSERVYLKKEEYKCVRENQKRKIHASFEDCIIEYFEKKEE